MKLLDCESSESLDKSLELILGVPINEINDFLIKFDLDKAYAQLGQDELENYLVKHISKHFDVECNFDGTCWFHVTRAFDRSGLELGISELGILPSDRVLDKIWDDLFTLVKGDFSNKKWADFRERLESDVMDSLNAYNYNLRLNADMDKGPMAILIGESIFSKREYVNEDYFDLPEIIRDISRCFYEEFEYDLLVKYLKNTKKYTIKFKTEQHDEFDLGCAILYKYMLINNIDEPYLWSTFSGHGKSISPKDIIKIDEIPDVNLL